MHILVTGGAGYIGSTVVADLVQDGHSVTVVDSLEKGHRTTVHPDAHFIQGDLASDDILREAFSRKPLHAVLHFAAYIEAGESMRNPARFFRNNTANTLRLAEAAVQNGVRKFIFSSTAAVYGEPQYTPIDEDHPTVPTNAYGMAKLLADQGLDWIARLHDIQCTSLRYFNAAGAGQELGEDHRPETHLIPLVLETALGQRKKIQIFGTDYDTPDGTCVRDYIHVSDLSLAHLLVLNSDLPGLRHIFNLGNGRGFSNRQVLAAAERVTSRIIPVEMTTRRIGDPATLVASSERIRKELNWTPRFPDLEDIIQSAWDWKRKHPEGYIS